MKASGGNLNVNSFLSNVPLKETTPQHSEKHQRRIVKMARNEGSPNEMRGSPYERRGSPNERNMFNKTSGSPNNLKQTLKFPQSTHSKQLKPTMNMNSDYSSTNQPLNFQSYSTKDNTKLGITSNIYNTSNSTMSIIDQNFKSQGQQNKPPLIPSLKSKMFQATLAGTYQNSSLKSGGYHSGMLGVPMSGETGITREDKIHPEMVSRTGFQSFSALNFQSATNFAMTSHNEELVLPKDQQQIVDYHMKEEQKTKDFYNSQIPFIYLQLSQIRSQNHYQNHLKKRIIFSSVQEVDRCINEQTLLLKNRQDNLYPSFEEWQQEMNSQAEKQSF